jgi:hypothetical protein
VCPSPDFIWSQCSVQSSPKHHQLARRPEFVSSRKQVVVNVTTDTKKQDKIGPGLNGLFQQEKLSSSGKLVTERIVTDQIISPFPSMPFLQTN